MSNKIAVFQWTSDRFACVYNYSIRRVISNPYLCAYTVGDGHAWVAGYALQIHSPCVSRPPSFFNALFTAQLWPHHAQTRRFAGLSLPRQYIISTNVFLVILHKQRLPQALYYTNNKGYCVVAASNYVWCVLLYRLHKPPPSKLNLLRTTACKGKY